MSWIDAHIHLDQYEQQQLEQVLLEAEQEEIKRLIAVSVDLASSQKNEQLYKQYPALVYPCYGYHPEQPLPSKEEEDALFAWIEQRVHQNEPFAIGEVGLPYYKEQEALENGEVFELEPYVEYLIRWFEHAQKWNKPIVLHVIYEHVEKVLDILNDMPLTQVHFHWYKGSDEATAEIVRRGYMISITPDVLYESHTQKLLTQVPLSQIMLETDGPWPFEAEFAGQLTTPTMVKRSCNFIAQQLNVTEQDVAKQLYENSKRFYQLD